MLAEFSKCQSLVLRISTNEHHQRNMNFCTTPPLCEALCHSASCFHVHWTQEPRPALSMWRWRMGQQLPAEATNSGAVSVASAWRRLPLPQWMTCKCSDCHLQLKLWAFRALRPLAEIAEISRTQASQLLALATPCRQSLRPMQELENNDVYLHLSRLRF